MARRLKVSHQAPYKHFPSRDHILAEVVSRAFADFAGFLDQRPRSPDPMQDLGHLGRAYLTYAQANPLHYRLMFGTPLPNSDQHPEMMRQARYAFSILRDTIARIDTKRTKADIDLDAMFVWSTVHGLASIMQSPAAKQLGLGSASPARAAKHTLDRIGDALAMLQRDRK